MIDSKAVLAERPPDYMDHSQGKNFEKFEYDLQDIEIMGKSIEVDDLMLE